MTNDRFERDVGALLGFDPMATPVARSWHRRSLLPVAAVALVGAGVVSALLLSRPAPPMPAPALRLPIATTAAPPVAPVAEPPHAPAARPRPARKTRTRARDRAETPPPATQGAPKPAPPEPSPAPAPATETESAPAVVALL